MMDRYYDVFETPIGWMGALASPVGLRRTTLPQATFELCASLLGPEADHAQFYPGRFTELREALSFFWEGSAVDFRDQPIDVGDASSFLRVAWEACRSIPTGETRTYGWLAAQAGRPAAARAAGQAMARNRLPIVVPCHRVIASDGGLRGFGRGASQLDLKRCLLELEAGDRSA